MLLYKEEIHVVANPSQTKFYKVMLTMEIHVTSWGEIQTTYDYDVISLKIAWTWP